MTTPSAVPVLPSTATPPRLAWPAMPKLAESSNPARTTCAASESAVRRKLEREPAIGRGQLERRDAHAVDAKQSQLLRIRRIGLAKFGHGFLRRKAGGAEQPGGAQKTAQLAGLQAARHGGKIAVARPGERLAGIEGRRERMRACQAMAGHDELPVAGHAVCGIPAARANQGIQNQRLQRGAGCGDGARRVRELMRRQQAAACDIKHNDARVGRLRAPRGRLRFATRAQGFGRRR